MHVLTRRSVQQLLREQDGVVSRVQLLALGVTENDVRRLLRRRELVVHHDGVYVDHTGPPTWKQRAWAAVLALAPAALCDESALRAVDGPGRRGYDDDGPIHVAVDRHRNVAPVAGTRLRHITDLEVRTLWNVGPPRMRVDHVGLDLASRARVELDAVAVLADLVSARRTTAARLLTTLAGRRRVRRRRFLQAVLTDIDAGTCSVLEHGFLDRVERPHGLPGGARQLVALTTRGRVARDVDYQGHALVVELDGRLFHEGSRKRDADLERDLDTAVDGRQTVRLGWGQVFGRPCATAAKLAALLRRRGWTGEMTRCPRCPADT